MAVSQISLLFKKRILSVHPLKPNNDFIIGNSEHCQLYIDSLAISPQHAKISYKKPDYFISPLDNEAVVLINSKKVESSETLSDGDTITIGKHTLHFSFNEDNGIFQEEKIIPNDKGWIQYLNGHDMGKTLPITNNAIEISDAAGDNIAMISSRSDGFYLSYLKGEKPPLINNKRIGEKSERLADNSKIVLGSQEVLFYLS